MKSHQPLLVVVASLVASLLAVAPDAAAQSIAPALLLPTGTNGRPNFQVLRFSEDWSVLRDPALRDDLFDSMKYIPLTDDGWAWVSFGGSVRERLEVWNNFNFGSPTTVEHDDVFLLSRLLYHMDLHLGPHVRIFAEGKNAFSTERELLGGRREADELDLQNGFIDLNAGIFDTGGSLTFRAGRQELLFGKQRLVGPLNWSTTRRTWDGFSGIFAYQQWTVHGFWTQLAAIDKYHFNQADAQTALFGVYAAGKVPTTDIGLDLYYLGLDRDDDVTFNGTTGPEDRHTVGGRVYGKVGGTNFDYDLEGAYQFGDVGAGDISAYMVATQLGYTLTDLGGAPRFFVGFDYASGDDNPGGDVQTFNQLYPTGHIYLGFIDAVGRQNAIDLSTGVSVKPTDKLVIALDGHIFWRADAQDAMYNVSGGVFRAGTLASAQDIGSEIDLTIKYQIQRHVELTVGYSHFFADDFINQSGPSQDADWGYVQLQFTF